jgi:hypothetical protein
MYNLSINQALTFWDRLTRCYHRVDHYGGSVAEIYISSMMEHSSIFANNPNSTFCKDEVEGAKKAMRSLISKFEKTYPDARVQEVTTVDTDGPVEYEDLAEGVSLVERFPLQGTWRVYLRVTKQEEDVDEGDEEC